MGRIAVVVGLVALLMATGVATASLPDEVRLPVSISPSSHPDSVVVAKGDHLWKISARRLGVEAPESHIARYWLEVIEVNTPRLRSGDPDLIYPGEIVELPTIDG